MLTQAQQTLERLESLQLLANQTTREQDHSDD
jgi:hypothetical protein